MANKSRNAKGADCRTKRSAGSQQRVVSSDREQLIRLASRVAYVLAHDYRLGSPVGTREVALRDLMMEYSITVDHLQAANDQAHAPVNNLK